MSPTLVVSYWNTPPLPMSSNRVTPSTSRSIAAPISLNVSSVISWSA